MRDKKTLLRMALPLFTINLINGGISSVNAVIQLLADELQISLSLARMVSTLPSVVVMIVTLIAGNLVERKITYRQTIFTGIFLYIIGGLGPVFVNNIWLVLVLRAIFGAGMGCFGILNSLYIRTFEDKALSNRMIGYGWSALTVGAIFMKLSAGYLGEINWHYAFLPYGLSLVTLVLLLLLFKEPSYPAVQSEGKTHVKIHWTPKLVGATLLQLCSALFIYPILTGMSTFLAFKGIGGSALTGWLGSVFTIAGFFVGMICAKLNERLKRFMVPLAFCLPAALGYALVLTASGSAGICAGCFLCGVANYTILPTVTLYVNHEVSSAEIPQVTSLIWALNNLGIFASSYVFTIADKLLGFFDSSDAGRGYLLALIIFVAVGLVTAIIDIRPASLKKAQG